MSEGYYNDFSYSYTGTPLYKAKTVNITPCGAEFTLSPYIPGTIKQQLNDRYGVGKACEAAASSLTDYILHGPRKMAVVPNIYDVKVYNDKVVKVIFADRTTETAVCQEGDKFDLDIGITVCLMKKMLGRNEYFRILKKAKKNAAAHRELERKSEEAANIRKRQRAKREERKRARRERRNKELAAAIADAVAAKKKR